MDDRGLLDLVYMDLKLDTPDRILLPIVLIMEMLDFLPPCHMQVNFILAMVSQVLIRYVQPLTV